jgi:colanic acid/amylovoran biosynthesis protein
MLRQGLSRLSGLFVREPISLSQVEELDVAVKASLCWDSAFAVPPAPLPPDVEEALGEPFVAVTVRQWAFPYSDAGRAGLYERYLASVGGCVERMKSELGLRVVVAPQVIGPTAMENDLAAAAHLAEFLPVAVRAHARFLSDDLTAGQLSTLYGRAEIVLATRFHSAILAIAAGTPAVAISYHGPKSRGIMEMLGLERFVVDIDHVTPDGLWALCAEAYEERKRIAGEIRRRHEKIQTSIAKSTRQMLGLARE